MNKMNKKLIPFILVPAILIVVVSGCGKIVDDINNGDDIQNQVASRTGGDEEENQVSDQEQNLSITELEVDNINIAINGLMTYKNEEHGFEFDYPGNYKYSDMLIKLHKNIDINNPEANINNLSWYDQPSYLFVSLSFGMIKQRKSVFDFSLQNTTDDNKIKFSGGWEKCEKIREEVIGNKKVKVFAIDSGSPEMKVITHKNQSYIFMHYFEDDEIKIIDDIIFSFKFIE